ncbi:recombinase family protein [Bacillus sp. RS11]|uniref:recombinase family protein n=1 Tax=Lysinibacillus sp. RS11 TaxID=3242682 RepID=UPI0035C68157
MVDYGLEKGIKTVVYARVSTEDEKQLNSFEAQEAYYKEFCEEQGYKFLHTYKDQKSGKNADRDAFQEMLKDAGIEAEQGEIEKNFNFKLLKKKPKFNLIIVKDVARFARNMSDTSRLINLLKLNSVYVLFETQGICTNGDSYETILPIYSFLAENESRANSKRQRFAMKYRIKNGIFTGNALPFGYERDENNTIVVNEEKAKIVRYVFERAIDIGSRMIARELNEKGWKTETGIAWGASQVHQILEKKAYYGNPEINKYHTPQLNAKTKRVKGNEVETEGKLPVIVPKELYDEAREAIQARTSTSGIGQRQPKTEDIFHRKVKCGCCGGMYTRKRTIAKRKNKEAKEYYSYYCLNKNKKSVCTNKRTVADNVLKKLVCSATPVVHVKLGFGDTYSRIAHAIEQMKKRHDSVIKVLNAQCDEIETHMEQLEESYFAEKVEAMRSRIAKRIEVLTDQKTEIVQKINKLTFENLDYYLQEAHDRKKQIEESSKAELTDDDKIALVKEIFVYDDDTFDFSYYTPNYNDIIMELNELLDDDLKINESSLIEERGNKYKFVYENKQFINADEYFQYDSVEEYEEIQYQMNELAREKANLH